MKVVGVSFDPPERNATFRENESFPFPLWTDTERELALHYGAASSASAVIASRVTVLLDEEGDWLLVYRPGFLAGLYAHAGEVLEDCQALFGAR